MSVRIDVTINGQKAGWMEITQQGPVDESEAANPGGLRFYRFRYNDGRGRTTGGEWVRHLRADGIWDLVRRVLAHDERLISREESKRG